MSCVSILRVHGVSQWFFLIGFCGVLVLVVLFCFIILFFGDWYFWQLVFGGVLCFMFFVLKGEYWFGGNFCIVSFGVENWVSWVLALCFSGC